ncbi:MAG TPA: hypothetical protein VLD67_08160 [Vicinamibacterales bacterium]|nr:hypothetical protein [Vicinamibacterales bacterium]
MFRRFTTVIGLLLTFLARSGGTPHAQNPDVRARIDALVETLAAGDPARFEAMAAQHFATEALERRTPEERKRFVERMRADFGR